MSEHLATGESPIDCTCGRGDWVYDIVGIIIGIVTWISHRYALKPLAQKVPWLWWIAPTNGEKPATETPVTSP